jgi:ankyrin repeat protein
VKVFSKKICRALKNNDNNFVMSLFKEVDISEVRDSYYRTLLHVSAASGNAIITEHLIKSLCIIDAMDEDGNTPLLLAVYFRHFEVVKLLMNAGADVCIANSIGRTPLFYAKMDECWILKVLFSEFNNNQRSKSEVLNLLMLAKLHERNSSNSSNAKTLRCNGRLFYGSRLQQSLLYTGEQMYGPSDLVELPLNKAIFLRDMHEIRMSLKYGTDPLEGDGNGCTALHAAATFMSNGNDFVQMILDHGGMIDVKDERGVTPLHVASAFCNVDFMKLLLKRGADIHVQDMYGRTPLYAVFMDSHRIAINRNRAMQLLLQHGANINIKPRGQCSILERTVILQDLTSRNFLLKHLARLTSQGSHIADYYFEAIQNYEGMQAYYAECKQELNTMMIVNVIGAISFFNILNDNTSKIASYARNEDFVQAFQAVHLEKSFPKYYRCLKMRFDMGVERMRLMERGAVLLSNIKPFLSPEHLVVQKILSYLKLSDLRKLCA